MSHGAAAPVPAAPAFIKEVQGELQQGYWQPQTYAEWEGIQKTTAFLAEWGEQQKQERSLRKMIGIWVFVLISFQIVGVFALVTLDAINKITLKIPIVQLLIPSVLAEVFGMGLVVVKYLFNPSRTNPVDTKPR